MSDEKVVLVVNDPKDVVVLGGDKRLAVVRDEKYITVDPGAVVNVQQHERYVEVAASGPPGPMGPAGVGNVVVFDTNGIPAATWIINHGLNRLVQVTVVGDDGIERETDVDQSNLNTATITFALPFSGKALVS